MSLSSVTFSLEVSGETLSLEFTPAALDRVDGYFGDLETAQRRLAANSKSAVSALVRLGAGASDKEAKRLDGLVYRHGAPLLVAGLREYVTRLYFAGRPLDEIADLMGAKREEDDEESDTGNG